jgi:prephenate dehydrogenase
MRTVAIVGTGLIGTSVALALRRAGLSTYLVDRDPAVVATAARLGAGNTDRPTGPVDLAVLAVPPGSVARVLREQQQAGLARHYTDVAGAQAGPQARAARLGCDLGRHVGGHPIAGRELAGPAAARADLFQGRTWVLTPTPQTAAATLDAARELVARCGAHPVTMSAARHDRAVAASSHVPHLVASLLAARLADADPELLRLCGAGIRDATRIAAGDPQLWADILTANARPVAAVLAELAADLTGALHALSGATPDGPAPPELLDVLLRGARGRAALDPSPAPPGPPGRWPRHATGSAGPVPPQPSEIPS